MDWCLHIRPDCCIGRHGFDTILFGPTTSPCDCSVVPQTQITYAYYVLFMVPQLRLTESRVRRQANDASNSKPARIGVAPRPLLQCRGIVDRPRP